MLIPSARGHRLGALTALALMALAAAPATTPAQRPSPAQAQQLLRTQPGLAEQLRRRLLASGLTPAQVRARLQAEGYPSSLLDAYLEGGDSTGVAAPREEMLEALARLGITDTIPTGDARPERIEGLTVARADSIIRQWADSAGVDPFALQASDSTLPPRIRELLRQRDDLARAERVRRARVDSGFTLFGMDVFARQTTQFDPNAAGPVDRNYRLGPGDQLVLILTGDVEEAYTLDVTREGFVVIPAVGQVYVNHLTLGELDDLLYTRLGRVYSGVRRGGGSTRFSLSVARLRTNQVFVAGDVRQPGSYRVSSTGTILSALYAAGGPTENGTFRRVELRRGGRAVGTFDLYDYLLRGDAGSDLRLESGDVVFVPPRGGRARIWGEVIRPATYEIAPGETLADLMRAAGGLTATADPRRVQVDRVAAPAAGSTQAGGRTLMEVQLGAAGAAAVPLQAGDVVRVYPIAERETNRVAVLGNVWQPGNVAFRPGMRLSEALRQAGGLRPDSYLGQVLVSRLQPDSSRVQLRAAVADTSGRAIDDIPLAEGDQVQVFSLAEFRPRRYVVVSGAVHRSGRYPYREGMTLRDLVLMAGGPTEAALLTEAEIARLPETRAEGVTARTVRVPVDSSYVLSNGRPAAAPRTGDVMLEPYDNVLILREPGWTLPRSVVITGEVKFPGRYTLQRTDERLTDVIARAGGLTRDAYAGGVVFVRRDRNLGRIGLDLPAALENARHRDNLVLANDDSIAIPTRMNVVEVRGAVNSPNAVAWVPGKSIDYYVAAAGGASRTGDARNAFVTQPNGKVESKRKVGPFTSKPEPRAGAVVFVPEEDSRASGNWASTVMTITQVLASLAGVIILARSF